MHPSLKQIKFNSTHNLKWVHSIFIAIILTENNTSFENIGKRVTYNINDNLIIKYISINFSKENKECNNLRYTRFICVS